MSKKRKKKNKARQNRLNKKNKRNAQKAKKRRSNKSPRIEKTSVAESNILEQLLNEYRSSSYDYPDEDDIFNQRIQQYGWDSDFDYFEDEDVPTNWMDQVEEVSSSEDNSYNFPYNDRYAPYSVRDFINEMKKFEHIIGHPSPYIEYNNRMIAYAYMSPEQLNYYFYWRDLAREEIFEPASYNYYFLYFTELLNLIGVNSDQEAFRKLNVLCKRMIDLNNSYELTDIGRKIVAQSIFDFTYVHHLDIKDIDNFIWQNLGSHERSLLAVEMLDSDRLILPFEIINDLTEFDVIAKSKIYLEDPKKYKEALINSVFLIDSLYRQKKSEGLLNYPSHASRYFYIDLFENINIDTSTFKSEQSEIHYNDIALVNQLNGIVQEVENTFRELYHQRGKLRKFSASEWVRQIINQFIKRIYGPESDYIPGQGILPAQEFLENLNKPKKIELDLGQLEKIRSETEIVQELLETEEEKQSLDPLAFVDSLASVLSGLSRESYDYIEFLEEIISSKDRIIKITDLNSFKEILNQYEKRYLTKPLFQETGSTFKINEIYIESLKHIFNNKINFPFLNKPRAKQENSELEELYNNLDQTCQEFLKILIENPNNTTKLEDLAQKEMTMTDLIIDEINNQALLIIDDIILEIDNNEPFILEEYFEPLKKIIEMEKD